MVLQRDAKAVSVSQPPGFAVAFKSLARKRTENSKAGSRVTTAQDLHQEAVRNLLDTLRRGKRIVFVAPPYRQKRRTTMWFEPTLLSEIKEVANLRNVSTATFVLTACLAYLKRHGVDLQ
jgi:hypothetical protein